MAEYGYIMSDDEDYGLEYSEDSTSEPDVDLENQYYHSKALKEEDPVAALAAFQKVIELQGSFKGEWGFRALKQIVKINFKLKNYEETVTKYKEMLGYIKNAVTKNHGEKSINSILDYTSSAENIEVLQGFYETTLDTLKHTKNDRLWFKTNVKLGKVFLERREFNKVANIVRQLYQCCQTETGEDDVLKGTQLLEIYALQIQMYTEQKNNKLLKELYDRSLRVRSAIPHPLIMSVIRECGGKMHLRAGNYEQAYTDFFEAFKNYDESGSLRRTTCLKYLILTSMLMKSAINPFDSQEAKPYKLDAEVQAMTNLITAYQNNDMKQFENYFQENKESLLNDPFICENIEILLKNVRTQVLLALVKPYKKVALSYISRELNIPEDEIEHVLISCILDGLLKGRIDQLNQVFIKNTEKNEAQQDRYNVIKTLTDRIDKIHRSLTE